MSWIAWKSLNLGLERSPTPQIDPLYLASWASQANTRAYSDEFNHLIYMEEDGLVTGVITSLGDHTGVYPI